MKFETKHIDDIIIFKLNEKRLDGKISGLVKAEFTLLLKVEGETKLIIDLSDVENCDSTGLSALLVASRLISYNGGGLIVVAPSDKIKQLINITQLNRVLTLCDTVEEALDDLSHSNE
jgi:anti-sigma B factor antagonist